MKIAVRMAVCGVLAATAVTMAAYTAADFRRANAARAAGYTLAASDGYVAVYAGEERKTPLRVTEIELATLREADRALIEQSLRESGAWEKVECLDHGIDTTLTREFDDKGAVLSGGESQKISLARVFAEPERPFVLLDEPSSALDPIAEHKMFENMMRAAAGRAVVFISHRLSSATTADRIYMMEKGRVIESGSHAELMALNGKYADMFRKQAENYVGI